MSKNQKVGSVKFSASVTSLPGAYSVTASDAPRIKHQVALLNRALHVLGSYRVGRYFHPENGAISIDVIFHGASGESTSFDASSFNGLARKLNDVCAKALNEDQENDDLSAHAQDMAEQNNLDVERVKKVIQTAKRHSASLIIIDNNSQLIPLGSPPSPAHQDNETMDIDVAECTNHAHVQPDNNSYDFPAHLVAHLKPGDKIQVSDIGPPEKRRCISARSAAPLEAPATPDLFD